MRKIMTTTLLSLMFLTFVCCEKSRVKRPEAYPINEQMEHEEISRLRRQIESAWMQKVGRYEILETPQSANIFLLDTLDGRSWILVRDPETKKLWWQKIEEKKE